MSDDPDHLDALVRRVRAGEKAVIDDLVSQVHVPMRHALAAWAPDVEILEEAVQDALVAAIENLDSYVEQGTFLPWVKAIARNRLRRLITERHRHARLTGDHLDQLLFDPSSLDSAAEESAQAMIDGLKVCLSGLKPDARRLLERHHVEGVSIRRLSQTLRRTESWVVSSLFRIRRALRTCLNARVVS